MKSISFFETTIRCLGGLLSAYDLIGDKVLLENWVTPHIRTPHASPHVPYHLQVLLEKAKDLGGRLEKAFSSPSGMPWAQISLATGSGSAPSWTGGSLLLAEVGTVQLEFFGLAHHSGEGHFREKAQRVIDLLDQNGGPLTDGGRLWPIHVRPESGRVAGSQVSWGAMGDSYYEYAAPRNSARNSAQFGAIL